MAKPEPGLKFGDSELVPYDPAEDHRRRHQRRLDHAVDNIPLVRAWCSARGVTVRVSAGLFEMEVPYAFFRWWPATGRVSFCCDVDGQPTRVGKCHDYDQAIKLADWWLGGTRAMNP